MGTTCCSQREKDGHSRSGSNPDSLAYNKMSQASEVQKSLPFINSYFEESKFPHYYFSQLS